MRQRHQVGDADDALDQLVVAGAVQQLERDRGAVLEPGLQPHRVGEDLLEALRSRRHEQGQALRQAGERGRVRHLALDIAGMREVGALLGAAAGDRDPVREVAVAAARLRQQHQPGVRRAAGGQGEADLAADDEVELLRLRLDVRAHHAGERALVGDRQGAVAQRSGPLDQLLGMRGAGQEAEVAAAVELGVGREGSAVMAREGGLAGAQRGRTGRRTAGCVGGGRQHQAVERARGAGGGRLQDVGVDHGGADVGMAEQLLHGADVGAGLQQVGGERMAQRVHGRRLGDAGGAHRRLEVALQALLVEVMAATRQRRPRPAPLPRGSVLSVAAGKSQNQAQLSAARLYLAARAFGR